MSDTQPPTGETAFGADLRVVKEANAYAGRGMREGWLRGQDATKAMDLVEDRFKAACDAEIGRAKQAQRLFEENPELTFYEVRERVWGIPQPKPGVGVSEKEHEQP